MRLLGVLPLLALVTGCQTASTESSSTRAESPNSAAQTERPSKGAVRPVSDVRASAETGGKVGSDPGGVGHGTPLTPKAGHELAEFAGGCFWGTEDAFRKLPGVTATAVGFTGGHVDNPSYERVCDHNTGHAETVLIEFDPAKISYAKLLKAFFQIHDPTTLDRQGPDAGDQYRSEIFTFSDEQAKTAKQAIKDAQKNFSDPIVTKVEPVKAFWEAEDYHQQYAEKTGFHGCPTGKLDGLL